MTVGTLWIIGLALSAIIGIFGSGMASPYKHYSLTKFFIILAASFTTVAVIIIGYYVVGDLLILHKFLRSLPV